jgi:DNA-binding transcriptional LysR family regulator
MNLHDIQTFVSIAQLGGVTRAAGRLHRSQPAITRRIRALELQLGAPLLERSKSGTALTEAGRAFLPYAEAVLSALKDGTEAVTALHNRVRGSVSVAIVGTLAATTLPARLKQFSQANPEVRLELRTANSDEVSDLVRRAEVNLGLRYHAGPEPELTSVKIAEERMVVACPPEHPCAGRRLRDLRPLAGDRWVAFPTRGGRESLVHPLLRRLTQAGFDMPEIVQIDSLTAQKGLVEAGFGIALLPESSIQEELRLGTLRVIDSPLLRVSQPVCVVYRRNGYLSAATRSLLEILGRLTISPRELGRTKRREPSRRVGARRRR